MSVPSPPVTQKARRKPVDARVVNQADKIRVRVEEGHDAAPVDAIVGLAVLSAAIAVPHLLEIADDGLRPVCQ